ncbi:MAG TPA: redox-sensing transcriptional repressor Rex [Firmicutes bacterium]|nr:redox-sensing transcriptional repressor Rex [Bacillota bacterium]
MLSKIPNATIKRLALYRRCFVELDEMGIKRIQSSELSQKIAIDSATIRRDFSYLGELGRQGYGYEVRVVLEAFNNLLKTEDVQKAVLIGVGNLGRALLNYFSSEKFKNRLFRTPVNVVAGFDINESIVGSRVGELPLYHLDELKLFIQENNVKYAIIALPADGARKVASILDSTEIKGILNLSSTVISVNKDIKVHEVDLNMELETLFFYVFQKEQDKETK